MKFEIPSMVDRDRMEKKTHGQLLMSIPKHRYREVEVYRPRDSLSEVRHAGRPPLGKQATQPREIESPWKLGK